MSNSAATVVMFEPHKSPFYGKASKDPKVEPLEEGHSRFCYRKGKVIFRTFDAKHGGWRRTLVKRAPSRLAVQLESLVTRLAK